MALPFDIYLVTKGGSQCLTLARNVETAEYRQNTEPCIVDVCLDIELWMMKRLVMTFV